MGFPKMSPLVSLLNLVAISGLVVGVSLSDGASVQIPEGVSKTDSTSHFTLADIQTGSLSRDQFLADPRLSFSLTVAQCRATCLEKFAPQMDFIDADIPSASLFPSEVEPETGTSRRKSGKLSNQEILSLLPGLFRFRSERQKRSRSFPRFNCSSNLTSPCFSCWNTCQLLEPVFSQPEVSLSSAERTAQHKQLILSQCSQNPNCTTGCQQACSFYQRHRQISSQMARTIPSANPVMHILPEKITWPITNGPVVYLVVEEYPDKTWKQIAQTTETEITLEIPEFASKYLRILVVDPQGIISIYSADQEEIETTTGFTSTEEGITITTEINDNGEMEVTQVSWESEDFTEASAAPLDLQLVSLIHEKSLVIAEFSWNAKYGANPNQEYVVTWELAGGGLKGHLVTDTNSVTLSLWPDTTYQVQVAEFTQNLDNEGQQPEPVHEDTLKSLPLLVNTNMASFSLEGSMLLIQDEPEDDTEDFPTDDSDNLTETEDNTFEAYQSIGYILGVAVISMLLVFVLFTLVALTWLKLLQYFSVKPETPKCPPEHHSCFTICFTGNSNSTDDKNLHLICNSPNQTRLASVWQSPLHCVSSYPKQHQPEVPVISVISSGSMLPYCYANNGFSVSTSDLPFSGVTLNTA